ncbi:hypothetical protein D9615_008151 [Tricholomella constricta]|uniref:Uncharacterized protein n=1 Tax=Tricholomella constricta TaxID=117010 RepID=A0A8H5H3B1_9AGAR|nr:hypothetical protein D9615_008151 [Tricholomella constricta]
MTMFKLSLISLATLVPLAACHSAFFHPSMYGFNVTDKTFPFDNRPVAPLRDRSFADWWFHGHLDFPPHPTDFFELPAGKPATAEIACTKSATSYFASSEGGDVRNATNPNDVCPGGRGPIAYHTQGFDDLMGCALAIAYKSDVKDVEPEDFTIFSVNQTCVWTRFTDFQVPARMPPCPPGGCTCAFFWIHSPNGGGDENYMNGFKCNVTGSTAQAAPLATPKVARRCGVDPINQKFQSVPGNCTYGAKQPFYWVNKERNNMFEAASTPPVYNDLYNFLDGAQDDIFQDSYADLPDPSPVAAVPVLAEIPVKPEASTSGPVVASQSKCKRKLGAASSGLAVRSLSSGHDHDRNSRSWVPTSARRSRKLHQGSRESLWRMF